MSPTPPVECLSTVKELERRRIEYLAGEAHRLGEGGEFLRVQSAQEDGHQEGSGLGVCRGWILRGAVDQRVDEALNLGVGEGEAVALVLDDVDGMNGHEFAGPGLGLWATVHACRWDLPLGRLARQQ